MIVEKQTNNLVLSESALEDSIAMTLDLDSAQFLMQMLSKNLYSDAIGSTIRETVSNAIDSHRRAGVTDPVIVTLDKDGSGHIMFTVEDFGIGLDDKDVIEILSKYGKSTKRESKDEFGMFGLGFKSPLAYSSTFYFVTRKDGMERKYMMYEGEDNNMIDRLYEKETSERNGLKVSVPVSHQDQTSFVSKIREQLAYFENVYFDINTYSIYSVVKYPQISNNFKIYRNELFQKSELYQTHQMHLCLDDVYYPLDFTKLGIDPIKFPVGLRFTLSDGIFPTPNRENIRYTQEAIAIIMKRIVEIADYIVTKMNEVRAVFEVDNSKQLLKLIDDYNSGDVETFVFNGDPYEMNALIAHSNIPLSPIKIKGVKELDAKLFAKTFVPKMLYEYTSFYRIGGGRFLNYNSKVPTYDLKSNKVYIFNEHIPNVKKTYIKEQWGNVGGVVISKVRKFHLFNRYKWGDDYSYYDLLNLKNHPRNKWRTIITDFQTVIKLIVEEGAVNIDELEVPEVWKEKRKQSYSRNRNNGQKWENLGVTFKKAQDLEKNYSGRYCKFESDTESVKEFFSYKGLTIYSLHDSKDELELLYSTPLKKTARLITLSMREMTKIEKMELHNFISIDDFMKGKTRPFKKLATAILISNMMNQYRATFNNLDEIKELSRPLYEKLSTLVKYKEKYLPMYQGDTTLKENISNVAKEFNLYDPIMMEIYNDVKATLDKHSYINEVFKVVGRQGSHFILKDMCKYHKFRLNYENYKLKKEQV